MGAEAATGEMLGEGLARALARCGIGAPRALRRLTGGATMESWRFEAGDPDGETAFVLRRAPSLAFMEGRPYGHDVEAAVIRAAHGAGVKAPEVVVELVPEDGIGSGFVMRALPGTPDPRQILAMEQPGLLLGEVARDLARIHSLGRDDVPPDIPELDYREGIESLRQQFEEAGGNRPLIALGLRWLIDNVPERIEPVLNHGDYRLGNILAQDSRLTGVLDWELAHFGDPHEDLAFGCMAVWRFARYDRPALGLGAIADYLAAYEAESGTKVDPARFRFWTIYRTVWWALGCLRCAQAWRNGADRTLERVVISRRTSEQELDLLLLLEEDAPERERLRTIRKPLDLGHGRGEASYGELAQAVLEILDALKGAVEGHDRFQLAVARNALGIIERECRTSFVGATDIHGDKVLLGKLTLRTKGYLASLREDTLAKCQIDSPKYPALAIAQKKWTEGN